MAYIYELEHLLDVNSIGIIIELLFVTSCLSTILFFLTKNQNVSLLSSPPIFFVLSSLQYGATHLFLLIIAMLTQGLILLVIEQQSKKKIVASRESVREIQSD